MDIFKPIVKEEQMHPNFKSIMNDRDLKNIVSEWVSGFQDRDNKIVREFQTSFNSSFWEFYLHACLRNLGFQFDFSYNRPDFIVEKKKKNLIIEAVSTSNPREGVPENERLSLMEDFYNQRSTEAGREKLHKEIIALATERISNSISTKSKKYLKEYSQLEYVKDKPFVLAIGAFEQPFFYMQGNGAILKVLYGLTKAKYLNNLPYFEYRDSVMKSTTSASIEIGLFNSNKYEHISAILFSPVATTGKARALSLKKRKDIFFETYRFNQNGASANLNYEPHTKYRESLFDGLSLLLNPYAKTPVDESLFGNLDIAIYYDIDNWKCKHGFLYRRTVDHIMVDTKEKISYF
ncbi:hypothetical protein ABEX29_02735 [Brevibacillus porteri]|uniref:hypothetical protein n=1 Tax=Brevibacillus porteri TaxID=2126350 RepID=UPI003D1D5B95